MARGQLMHLGNKKAFVYVTNGLQSDGCVQSILCSWSECHLKCIE